MRLWGGRGPITEISGVMEIEPVDSGTLVSITATVFVAGLWARLVRRWHAARVGHAIRRALLRYDELARFNDPISASEARHVRLAAGGRERLASGCQALAAQGAPLAIVDRLRIALEAGDDLIVSRLRPFELADVWDLDRRTVVEVFLLAARLGLLELTWDVMCPLCRQPVRSRPCSTGRLQRWQTAATAPFRGHGQWRVPACAIRQRLLPVSVPPP